jgi:hypothetical protein
LHRLDSDVFSEHIACGGVQKEVKNVQNRDQLVRFSIKARGKQELVSLLGIRRAQKQHRLKK